MTACSRGDVVLIGVAFADDSGRKLRPAVVVSCGSYHRRRQEVVAAAITSNVARQLSGDHLIADWRGADLLFPSTATGILRTIRRTMIERKRGSMPSTDMEAIDGRLRRSLGLEAGR